MPSLAVQGTGVSTAGRFPPLIAPSSPLRQLSLHWNSRARSRSTSVPTVGGRVAESPLSIKASAVHRGSSAGLQQPRRHSQGHIRQNVESPPDLDNDLDWYQRRGTRWEKLEQPQQGYAVNRPAHDGAVDYRQSSLLEKSELPQQGDAVVHPAHDGTVDWYHRQSRRWEKLERWLHDDSCSHRRVPLGLEGIHSVGFSRDATVDHMDEGPATATRGRSSSRVSNRPSSRVATKPPVLQTSPPLKFSSSGSTGHVNHDERSASPSTRAKRRSASVTMRLPAQKDQRSEHAAREFSPTADVPQNPFVDPDSLPSHYSDWVGNLRVRTMADVMAGWVR